MEIGKERPMTWHHSIGYFFKKGNRLPKTLFPAPLPLLFFSPLFMFSRSKILFTSTFLTTSTLLYVKKDEIFDRFVWEIEVRRDLIRKRLLPKRIILLRHGESEGNVNKEVYERVPDNALELTQRGFKQAEEAGRKIKKILGDETVEVHVSPFQRTFQTSRTVLSVLDEKQVVGIRIEPRLREQEFGNTQKVSEMDGIREQQLQVGRFWFRFPGGESGADVYHRVASLWSDIRFKNYDHLNFRTPQNLLCVTHGLTMRFFLAVIQSWSPDTFETVWNPDNCEIWVLELNKKFKYKLTDQGSKPKSSRTVTLLYKDGRREAILVEDYLDIPPPRTENGIFLLKKMGIDPTEVEAIDFWNGKYTSNFAFEDFEVGRKLEKKHRKRIEKKGS